MDVRQVEYPEHLRRLAVSYRNAAYVAESVLTPVPVGRRTGWYTKWGKEAFQPNDDRREPGTRSRQVQISVDKETYRLYEWALNAPITDEELEEGQYEYPELETHTTTSLEDRVELGRERRTARIVTDVSVVTQNETLSGTAQWSDSVNSDPWLNALAARRQIRAVTGMRPNVAVIPFDVLEALKMNQSLRDRLPDNNIRILTEEHIRQLFEVQRIVVPEVVQDLGTGSFTDVWGRDVLFAYVNPNPQGEALTFGVTLRLRRGNPAGTGGQNVRGANSPVRRWRQEPEKAWFVEVGYTENPHIVSADCGFLYKNAIPVNWDPAA